MYGALEAGGTKMVCGIGTKEGVILYRESFPTTSPEETMKNIIDFFSKYDIKALGIGAFGPVDVNKNSKTYGRILDTPKTLWKNYDILGTLKDALNIPVEIDTDVNGSCLGELTYGSGKGLKSLVYITVGTGIGIGVAVEGNLVHGMLHPEGGHIYVPIAENDDFAGVCPYHGRCLEGMASGVSIEKRWNQKAYDLKDIAEVWEMEAHYLSYGIVNYILTYSPEKIILGGGVIKQEQLLPLIREKVQTLLNGYINVPLIQDIENYIVISNMNDNQGLLGCIALGLKA